MQHASGTTCDQRGHKKGGLSSAFFRLRDVGVLLADMTPVIFTLEPRAGLADKAIVGDVAAIVPVAVVIVVGIGTATERGGTDRARGTERGAMPRH